MELCWHCKERPNSRGPNTWGATTCFCTECRNTYIRLFILSDVCRVMDNWKVDRTTAEHAVEWAHCIAGTIDVFTSHEMVLAWAKEGKEYDDAMRA